MVAAISQRLAERAGLELADWIVEARATTRIAALAVTPGEYAALISSPRGAAELDALIEAVRVGESSLFRHRAQIAALVDHVVPALRGKRAIKVWSAGCSTGEEPYTLAAILQRSLPGTTVSIVATDVSAAALAVAQAATYPAAELVDVPEAWRDAFVVDGEALRVRPEVRALVRFERANLVDATTIRGCDLVWCRNVLIYFTDEARRRVVEKIVAATAPGGYVFVGYSETLRDVTGLHAVRAGDAVYYTRADRQGAASPTPQRSSSPSVQAQDRVEAAPPSAKPQRPPAVETTAPATAEIVDTVGAQPTAREVTDILTARLAHAGLARLVIDLDTAELLADDLAPVFRRARAAARAAHVELVLRATRSGTRRWLARHGLDEDAS
jgi:chemotaxis protein methyltransferase CheR